jgi:23S rRNA (cytosine1962-C5)-methyltransferase
MKPRSGFRAPPAPVSPRAAAELLERAVARRGELLSAPDTNVCRLFNARADGIDGLVLERFGEVLVAQLHEGRLTLDEAAARDLCAAAAQRVDASAVYRKTYPRERSTLAPEREAEHRDPQPWIGTPAPPELLVREHGVQFLVRPYDGYLTGLFLDHRAGRQRIRALAAGRRVLNLFAYTCGFSVAAALGGAVETTSVDIAKKFLEWGKRNFAANELALSAQRFIASDVFEYYRRAARQGRRYDLVILDPPTFSRHKGGRPFVLTERLGALVAGALDLLDPGGVLYVTVNHRETSRAHLERAIGASASAARRTVTEIEHLALPTDFAGDPDYAKSIVVYMQ